MTEPDPSDSTSSVDCEVVKWHTRQKHAFIEQYLSVWTGSVGHPSQSSSSPSLEIIDLFAGRGWCRVDPGLEQGAPVERWPGSAVLAARALRDYPYAKRLILNSCVPKDPSQTAAQQSSLRRAIEAELGPSPKFPVEYLGEDIETALEYSIRKTDPRFPTLWILDPYVPESLPWGVVEKITSLRHDYPTPGGTGMTTRRPELLITLITEGLQRNLNRNPPVITRAIGLPEETWRPLIDSLLDQGANAREAILYLYSERLKEIYNRPPTAIEVSGSGGNIVYALVFCSSHPAGAYMAQVHVARKFQKWQVATWKPAAKLVTINRSIARREGPGAPTQTSLDRYAL